MEVSLVVTELAGRDGILFSKDDSYRATAAIVVDGLELHGVGVHVDQLAAEALAIADLKTEYRLAFPPVKTVVVKTVSVDFDA